MTYRSLRLPAAPDDVEPALLATSRHTVENALALYCSAMDRRDAPAAARLLANADLFFKDFPRRHGHDSIQRFYADVFATVSAGTAHVVSNVQVGVDDSNVYYSCLYQRLSLVDSETPRLLGVGCYSGRFGRVSSISWWLEHHVTRL